MRSIGITLIENNIFVKPIFMYKTSDFFNISIFKFKSYIIQFYIVI